MSTAKEIADAIVKALVEKETKDRDKLIARIKRREYIAKTGRWMPKKDR